MNMTKKGTASILEKIYQAGVVRPTTLNGLPGMSSLESAGGWTVKS